MVTSGHSVRMKSSLSLVTSCPSRGRASSTFLALLSSRTVSRDLRNLGGWGESTLKGLALNSVGLSGTVPG